MLAQGHILNRATSTVHCLMQRMIIIDWFVGNVNSLIKSRLLENISERGPSSAFILVQLIIVMLPGLKWLEEGNKQFYLETSLVISESKCGIS